DLGRSYDAVIRVNSQSGKGGVSYLLEQEHGLVLPRRLQIEFSRAIQRVTDSTGKEVNPEQVHDIFVKEYLQTDGPWKLVSHQITSQPKSGDQAQQFEISINMTKNGEPQQFTGTGEGALAAF